jgi:hypothetical protein
VMHPKRLYRSAPSATVSVPTSPAHPPLEVVDQTHATRPAPRAFYLERREDPSGVSGTGRVAEGVVFSNGWVALVWLSACPSLAFYPSIENVEAIHGHGGKTRLIFA